MAKFNDLDGVILLEDLPAIGLQKGMVGTVIHIFTEPSLAYEVEFSGPDGVPIAQIPLTEQMIQKYAVRASQG